MDHEIALTELTDDDLAAVVALCREALDLPEDAAEAAAIVARLRDTAPIPADPAGLVGTAPVTGSVERRTVGFAARAGGALLGVVLGSVAHRDPSVGHIDLIAVHPRHRRGGIGRSLLTRAEAALAGLGVGEILLAGNPPYYAWPGIDVRYTPAVCAAMALGYDQDRTAWNMTADLSDPASPALRDTGPAQERLAAQGVTVRSAGPADVDALVAFARSTFGFAWGAEVAHSVGRAGAGCHLALREPLPGIGNGAGDRAGTGDRAGGAVEVLGFAAYGSSRPSWFGPMGTAPDAQGLGIGSVLLRRCLRDQRAAGLDRVQIGWVGPVPFYSSSAGARIDRVFFLYRKQF